MKLKLFFVVTILSLLEISTAFAQTDIVKKLDSIAVIEQKVMVPMRDGIRLATDIYRPKTDEPVPIIFVRTPYNINAWRGGEFKEERYLEAYEAVKRGYAYVLQNERGKFFSEGKWEILGTPLTDGLDALTWLSKQKWSNGNVGLFGCSSSAEWQMAVAAKGHPALKAIVPMSYGAGVGRVGNFYEQGNLYRGGAIQLFYSRWLYYNENDVARPTFPSNLSQEDLVRISRSFDLAPHRPDVNWEQAYKYLPVADIIKSVDGPKGIYDELVRRKPNDSKWYKDGLYHDDMSFKTPSMWFVTWYDISTGPNLATFNHVREVAPKEIADNQFLVIAPTLHCRYELATEETIVGQRNIGDARLDYKGLIYGWFDYWLKGKKNNITKTTPRVQYYTMGANKWNVSETWPPKNVTIVNYYLQSNGSANSINGDGKLAIKTSEKDLPDSFVYDPGHPVSTVGGNFCCMGESVEGGAFDQSTNEIRNDILVYSSEKLKDGVEITGTIEPVIYLSSDVKDTDITVKLIDVYPDGTAYNLDETIQRVRYREGYDKEVFMEQGNVYKVQVSPMSTSNYFAPGHRIRIEISSSNFPRFDRNLNTGGNNFDENKWIVAHNTIHHSIKYPSHIKFPVMIKTEND